MSRSILFSLFATLVLAGCADPQGESTTSGGGGSGAGGGAGTTSSDPTTGSGGGGTTTATTTLMGETVTIEMDSFDIASGEEVYKCQNFANPFGGDVDVSGFESHMTKGSHHLLLFYKNNVSNGPLEDCSGLEFAATPYSTQRSDDAVGFPEGVAAAIPSSKGLRLQSHYLNTSPDTITAHVVMTFHIAAPGTVKEHAGVLFVVQPEIYVEPSSTKEITYDCTVPIDMKVMKTASHMHKHGTKFVSTVAGKPFYNTETWDEPEPALFEPAMELKAGDPLHFACTFVNTGVEPLTFGESAGSNEMCILVAAFYPTPAGLTTIDCH